MEAGRHACMHAAAKKVVSLELRTLTHPYCSSPPAISDSELEYRELSRANGTVLFLSFSLPSPLMHDYFLK